MGLIEDMGLAEYMAKIDKVINSCEHDSSRFYLEHLKSQAIEVSNYATSKDYEMAFLKASWMLSTCEDLGPKELRLDSDAWFEICSKDLAAFLHSTAMKNRNTPKKQRF